MDIFSAAERLMFMTDASWARHTSPWSVYSRMLAGPLIFFAAWSVFWIGWYAIIPITLVIIWIFINPRLFPPARHADSWSSKVVLGERAFLNRHNVPIPKGFERAGWGTTIIAIAFFGLCAYGFYKADFWLAFTGWHATILAKLWFVDRMVWLWDVMKDKHPVYQAWAAADWTATFDDDETP